MVSKEIKHYINTINKQTVNDLLKTQQKSDVQKMLKMTYQQCCDFLINKYGPVPGDYFLTESMKSYNPKIKRGKEGLFIHHIDEDKAIMLSHKDFAIQKPFAFQKANRLVYCNLLEHYVLHIKIVEYPNPEGYEGEHPGIGGVVNFIGPELNDIYSGITYKSEQKEAAAKLVRNELLDYLLCIKK